MNFVVKANATPEKASATGGLNRWRGNSTEDGRYLSMYKVHNKQDIPSRQDLTAYCDMAANGKVLYITNCCHYNTRSRECKYGNSTDSRQSNRTKY